MSPPETSRRPVNAVVAAHEARHAAAALLLGLKVAEVRADNPPPDPSDNGYVQLDAPGFRPREKAIMTLVGNWGDPGWPPESPSATGVERDERQLARYVDELGQGQRGYELLVADAKHLAGTRKFESLAGTLELLLARGMVLRTSALEQIHRVCVDTQLEYKSVKAAARVAGELGQFTAIAAAWSVDRHGDQIVMGAFAKTIKRWQASGKRIPLHWNHSPAPKDIIGSIDPASVRETQGGLFVRGKVDLDGSKVAREAWRSMKDNAVSLSFGYMVTDSSKRADGIEELREVDLFEISIVPAPANADTRILSFKSAGESAPQHALEGEEKRQHRELRRECDRIRLEAALGWQPPPKPEPEPERKSVPTMDELRAEAARLGIRLPPPRRPGIRQDPDAVKAAARDEMFALLVAPVEKPAA